MCDIILYYVAQKYYCLHFTEEERDDQRDEVTGPGQHRELVTEAGLEAKSPDSFCDAL